MTAYRSSHTRRRRSRADIDRLKTEMYDLISAEQPMTVRQVFYRMVSEGHIKKTENEYNNVVVRLLGEMRLNQELPFHWLADNTRWMRKPRTYSSLRSMLDITANAYRRALWDDQDDYVEIWLEKDALAGVVYDVTRAWDVPLMVTRGYPSLTFLHTAAESISAQDKPATLYYFGDWDPAGIDIPRVVKQRIMEFAPGADITFQRVAVNPDQVEAWALPGRPTKRTDSRGKRFAGDSVELDAIPPAKLRQLVEECILLHLDKAALEMTRIAEQSERELLLRWDEALRGGNAV